jgi:hypothetical protein
MNKALTVAAVLSATVSFACGGSATARLKMRDATSAKAVPARSGAVAAAPSLVGYRMTAVYVSEDIDPITQDNTGRSSMIWIAPECGDDIGGCNPDGEPGPGPRVKTYFDFAQGADKVNAQLNSQAREVTPGAYKYVRVEFCKLPGGGRPVQPNVQWSVPGMAAPRSYSFGMCGVTSKAFATPMALAAGDSLEVTLDYDLAQLVVSGEPQAQGGSQCLGQAGAQRCFLDCADVGGVRYCMDAPQFSPSATATHAVDGGAK